MGIAELNRLMNTRPQPDTLHRLLTTLLTILEQPADQSRPLVNATYSVWYLGDDNLCRHLLENLTACALTPSEQSQIEVLLCDASLLTAKSRRCISFFKKTSASCRRNPRHGKSPSSNPLAATSFIF